MSIQSCKFVARSWFVNIEFWALIVAALALVWSVSTWVTDREIERAAALEQHEIDRVDARIANCSAAAATYFEMAQLYGSREYDTINGNYLRTDLDTDTALYAQVALRIGRAAQLCRIGSSDLTTCIAERVDGVDAHFVNDKGDDGNTYRNPVC